MSVHPSFLVGVVQYFGCEAYHHEEPAGFARIDTIVRDWLSDIDERWLRLVLDVGCGTGPALDVLGAYNVPAIGAGLGADVKEARETWGARTVDADQTFLPLGEQAVTLIFARQILEHSPCPLLTLCEWNRVLVVGGYILITVPQYPEGVACRNHYSCVPRPVWFDWLRRAGFVLHRDGEAFGDWVFMARKVAHFGMPREAVK